MTSERDVEADLEQLKHEEAERWKKASALKYPALEPIHSDGLAILIGTQEGRPANRTLCGVQWTEVAKVGPTMDERVTCPNCRYFISEILTEGNPPR